MRQILAGRMPETDPREVVDTSHQRVMELLNEYLTVGASKFVLLPFAEPDDRHRQLEDLAQATLTPQTRATALATTELRHVSDHTEAMNYTRCHTPKRQYVHD